MKHYAVIDTNVLVSAFLKWDSVPGGYHGWSGFREEYRVVLNRPKFGFSPVRIAETLLQINRLCVMESDLVEIRESMPDPKDIVFYAVELAHGKTVETHLVTGNVKHFPETPVVVTPRQMLDLLG